MEFEQIAVKLQETTDRTLRNEGRIKKLEYEHEAIHDLAKSVAVMAAQMKTMNKNVDSLTEKVDTLEGLPGRKWDNLKEKVLLVVVTAIVGYLLGQLGL